MKIIMLFLLIFGVATSFADDCVDCVYGLEGIPQVKSLSEAACTECNCYTRTHEETLKSLQKERATHVRGKLRGLIEKNTNLAVSKIAELDRLAKDIPNFNLGESCTLNQIKTKVAACSSEAGADQLKALFGHETIDAFLAEVGTKFSNAEGGSNSSNSCLSSAQLAHMKSLQVLDSLSEPLFAEIKNKKAELLELLNSNTKIPDILQEEGNDLLRLFVTNLAEHPMAQATLLDQDAFRYIVTNVDEFIGKQGKGIDFFSKEVFELYPQVANNIKISIGDVCKEFVNSVSEIACSGDGISLINNEDIAKRVLLYVPDDHKNGYDSMFVTDKSDADPIESSYVDHIYWCAAESCSKGSKIAGCEGLNFKPDLNTAIGNVAYQSNIFDQFDKSLPTYSEESLCKLATCSGTETQMNACYEDVRKELGEDADKILMSFDRATRSTKTDSTSSQGQTGSIQLLSSQPFSRSEFARSFLGSYGATTSGSTNETATASVGTNNASSSQASSPAMSAQSGGGNRQNSGRSVRANASRAEQPVVTASQAFSQFMDQRIREISNSPARTSDSETAAVSGANSRVERQALQSLSRASDTIDELRDSYRKSAFERMERMYEEARQQNLAQQQGAGVVAQANNSRDNTRSYSPATTNTSFQERPSIINVAANGASGSTGGASGATSQGFQNASAVEEASKDLIASRSIASGTASNAGARVTTQNGQPTLNVSLGELPAVTETRVSSDGVDTAKPFQLAVKVANQVFVVQVRPAVLQGQKMLEPMLDALSPSLRTEVLKSPLFSDYRKYLLKQLVTY